MDSNPAPAPNRIDVEGAVVARLRTALTELGYAHADLTKLRDLEMRRANATFRSIPKKPRVWHLPATQSPYAPLLQPGIERLRAAVEAGDDLTPFQSTTRLNANFHDHLLTDWGIHHFHLGTGQHQRDPNFVARTGPVLFAVPTHRDFFVLGVDGHGKWEDPQLLEIIHQNWPDLIHRYRVADNLPNAIKTAEEIKAFRKNGINGAVGLSNGATYRSVNIGRAGDGTPVTVVMQSNNLVATVRQLQKHIDETLDIMVAKVANKRSVNPAVVNFRFVMVLDGESREPGFYLDDQTTGYSFFLQAARAP